MSENIGASISERINSILNSDITLQNEYCIYRKAGLLKGAIIPRGAFKDGIKRFDKSQTAVVREIIEKYTYIGKNDRQDEVHIIITVKGGRIPAVIDFRDKEQHGCFTAPAWLTEPLP
jgi:hypothetical protein